VLVAYPDDEVLGLCVLLPRFTDLTLVHASDGAAGGERDQSLDELDAALKACDVNGQRHVQLDLPDGQLPANLARFIDASRQNRTVAILYWNDGSVPN
jgi:LmbE family N-acetylglucosaminyl deacetylase